MKTTRRARSITEKKEKKNEIKTKKAKKTQPILNELQRLK